MELGVAENTTSSPAPGTPIDQLFGSLQLLLKGPGGVSAGPDIGRKQEAALQWLDPGQAVGQRPTASGLMAAGAQCETTG